MFLKASLTEINKQKTFIFSSIIVLNVVLFVGTYVFAKQLSTIYIYIDKKYVSVSMYSPLKGF